MMIKWKFLWFYIIFCNFPLNFANQNKNEPQIVIENVIPEKITDKVLKIVIRKENGPVLFNLTLKKTKGILANHDTPIFTCLDDFGNEKRDIKFYRDLTVMQKVGNFSFYHDVDKKASAVLFSDKRGTYLEGIIGDQIRIHYFPMNYLNSLFNRSPRHAILIQNKKKADNVESIGKLDDETARKLGSAGDIIQNSVENGEHDQSVTNGVYYPEILVLLDYASAMKNTRDKIVKKLLVYWNAVDMLFATLESPKISLNLAAIMLPTSEKSFPFLSNDPSDNYVDFTDAIENVENFFYEYRNQITFDYDIIAAMTGAQLCVAPNQANPVMNCINGFAEPVPDITHKFDDDDELVTSAMILHYDNKISSYSNAAQKIGYMFTGQFTRKQKIKTCPGIMEEYYRKNKFSLTWSTCTTKKFETYLHSSKAQGLKNFPSYLPESLQYNQPEEEDENIEPVSKPELKPTEATNSNEGWLGRIGDWLFNRNQNTVTSTTESSKVLENVSSTSDVGLISSSSSSKPVPPLIEEKEPVDNNFNANNIASQQEITESWLAPPVTLSNEFLIPNDVRETVESSSPSINENRISEAVSSEKVSEVPEHETTKKEENYHEFLYTNVWNKEITPSYREDDPTESRTEVLLTDSAAMPTEKQRENRQEWVVKPDVDIVTSTTTEKSVYSLVTDPSLPVGHTVDKEPPNVPLEPKVLPVAETDYLTQNETPSGVSVPVTEASTLKNLQEVTILENDITLTSTPYNRDSEVKRESEVNNTDSRAEIPNSSNSLTEATWSNVETTTNLVPISNLDDDTQQKAQQRQKKRSDARRHKKLRHKESGEKKNPKNFHHTTSDTITQEENQSATSVPTSFEATSSEKPLVDVESKNALGVEPSVVEPTTVRYKEWTLPVEVKLTEKVPTLSVTEEPVRIKRYNELDDKIRLVATDEDLLNHVKDRPGDLTTSTELPNRSLSEENILAYERELATKDKFLNSEVKFSVSDDALLNHKQNDAGNLIVSTISSETPWSDESVLAYKSTPSDDNLLEHMQNDASYFPPSTLTSSTPLSDEELLAYKINTPAFDDTALNYEQSNDNETKVPAIPPLLPLFDHDLLTHKHDTPAFDDTIVNHSLNNADESPAVFAVSSLAPLSNEDLLTQERKVSISDDALLNHEQQNGDELAASVTPLPLALSNEDSLTHVLGTTPSDVIKLEHIQNNATDLPVSVVTSPTSSTDKDLLTHENGPSGSNDTWLSYEPNNADELSVSTTPLLMVPSDEDLLAHHHDESNSTLVSIPKSSELTTQPPYKQNNVEVDVTLEMKVSSDKKNLDVIEQILHGDIQNEHNDTVGTAEESGKNRVKKENVKKIINILEKITDIEN